MLTYVNQLDSGNPHNREERKRKYAKTIMSGKAVKHFLKRLI